MTFMGCNCKTLKNSNEINETVNDIFSNEKLSFGTKLKVCFDFIEFYFFFVTTSVINLMVNDKLEPKIPKWLIKKYRKY